MTSKDTYRYLIGAYFGIEEMDEYKTKEYILKAIKEYIDNFLNTNYIDFNIDEEEARKAVCMEKYMLDQMEKNNTLDYNMSLFKYYLSKYEKEKVKETL